MNDYILVCKKVIEKDDKKFPVFFGFHQEMNKEDGTFHDVLVPYTDNEGRPQMKTRNFKVVLKDEVKELLVKEDSFPYRLEVQKGIDYFITIDKDKDKKPRLDKYGKKHALVVVSSFATYEPVPYTSMDFEDMDNLE